MAIYTNSYAENIYQLIQSHQINYKIAVNESSPHYSSPFVITFKNNQNTNLQFNIDNGSVLEADNEENQNFIVTQDLIVQLKSGESKEFPIYAMCIERHDAAPGIADSYKIGGKADDGLVKLSNFINKNKNFEPDAQFLMWDIAEGMYKPDELDEFKINSNGEVEVYDWINETPTLVTHEIIEEPSKPKLMVNGEFEMNLGSTKNIHIAMFNENNVLVKELYKNPKTPAGATTLAYAFNSYDFPEETYYVKVVMNGKIVMQRTIDMSY